MQTRREFAALMMGTAAVAPFVRASNASDGFREPVATLPLVDNCDVIVAGGGPAGIAAAISAARSGAKVRLFEAQGALGGVWTSGLLGCMIDFGKSSIDREITRRLKALDAWRPRRPLTPSAADTNYVYEPEYLKLVCEQMCDEAGVDYWLHAPVVAAYRDATGRNVETVVTESKDGRRAWRAKVFVDCTGDGDLAFRAGCGFDFGGPDGTNDQPASLCAVAVSPHREGLAPFVVNHPLAYDEKGCITSAPKKRFLAELQRAGLDPSYRQPTLFEVHDGIYVVMMNHAYGLGLDKAKDITRATVEARREVILSSRALEKLGGAWKDFRIVATAEQIGHRAARRIHGRYKMTVGDVKGGAVFEDAVTTSNFGVDVHATTLEANRVAAYSSCGVKGRPFQIPLRACRAKDADNLYMAGRCISGDFLSMASYRVTGSAVAMGEAVGRAVAKATGV